MQYFPLYFVFINVRKAFIFKQTALHVYLIPIKSKKSHDKAIKQLISCGLTIETNMKLKYFSHYSKIIVHDSINIC